MIVDLAYYLIYYHNTTRMDYYRIQPEDRAYYKKLLLKISKSLYNLLIDLDVSIEVSSLSSTYLKVYKDLTIEKCCKSVEYYMEKKNG